MLELVLTVVALVLLAGLWSVIFRKAGYSGALAILMVIPVVNVVWFVAFTFLEWPVLREAARFRLALGQGSEADATSVLGQATRLEQHGEWKEAVALCELVIERMPGRPTADDAARIMETIRQKETLAGA
jgi:hypothetical protein